jgi:hypothetical protein
MQQQHPSGQPPEKKPRTSGNYTTGDPPNYEYPVNKYIYIFFCIKKINFFNLAKSKSTTDVSTTTTTTFLV